MKNTGILVLTVIMLSSCSGTSDIDISKRGEKTPTYMSGTSTQEDSIYHLILKAEENSSGKVRDVLHETRKMVFDEQTIIKGGCWDYLDAAWTRAGVPRRQREVVFKSQKSGPYAATNQLKAGDWLYYVNYDHNNVEHSGMFIAWVDESEKLGITLSYAGDAREEPARYRTYDLSGVYYIMRAQ